MSRLRTLLVDDNETFLNSVSMLLAGYRELEIVGLAHSAAEAIEQTELLHPHLVLMDMVMPGLNGIGGLEATTAIKRLHKAPRVVIWTLHSDSWYRAAAMAIGADGFVPKSELAKELLPLIRNLFNRKVT